MDREGRADPVVVLADLTVELVLAVPVVKVYPTELVARPILPRTALRPTASPAGMEHQAILPQVDRLARVDVAARKRSPSRLTRLA
ncbi:MAG: hypothetical protein JWR26_4447 [Pedosphaera sp.]|nr:hypothetical protein [Pedosphaera sp.]